MTWYHEGSLALKEARIVIAQYSLPRAAKRLKKERVDSLITQTQRQAKLQELTKTMQVSIGAQTHHVIYHTVAARIYI